ncbi:MAG TPA: hypothetical protein VIK05_10690 [Ilumatobacteraceae bacterium]|jgi:hypothetical protein
MITLYLAEDVQNAVPSWLNNWGGAIVLVAAVAAAIGVLWTKVIWHPRSPIRRTTIWVFTRLVGEPITRSWNKRAEHLINNVITPQLDGIRTEVRDLAEVNETQHVANATRIDHLTTEVEANNKITAHMVDVMGRYIFLDPALPKKEITGETPVTE